MSQRYPGVNRVIRELMSSFVEDERERRSANRAWLLAAIEHVINLDETLTPGAVETAATRRACALAIQDLKDAFDAYEASIIEDSFDDGGSSSLRLH